MATSKATNAKSWKKSAGTEPIPLELPSGNTALVKRPGLPQMLASKLFPDSLTAIAQKAVDSGKGRAASSKTTDKMLASVMADESKLADLFDTFDKAAAMVVQEPICMYHMQKGEDGKMVSMSEEDRITAAVAKNLDPDDVIWTDEVDLEDKMFIFQFCVGGTADLESFREQLSESVESLERGKDVEV